MKRPKKPAQRAAKLRVDGVDTTAEAAQLQLDVCRRLASTSVNPFKWVGLKNCSPTICVRARCNAACAFGARSHRLKAIPAAQRLLKACEGPFFEVRVSRAVWARKLGELSKISLMAAKQLNRRALDNVFNPDIIAIGSLKVTVVAGTIGLWRLEVHQVMAGVTRDELYRIFATRRRSLDNFVLIDEVKDIQEATARVLTHDLHVWQHPSQGDGTIRPKQSARAEYYLWLLGMSSGSLTIRYGCDRHFNKLKKKLQTMKPPKPRKPRRDPTWLARWQFGTESRSMMDLERAKGRFRIN
jgi:hypothetical protein